MVSELLVTTLGKDGKVNSFQSCWFQNLNTLVATNNMFINTFCRVIVQLRKIVFGLAMRTYNMNDAKDPYDLQEYSMGENIRVGNAET